jgi:hypothetical protein
VGNLRSEKIGGNLVDRETTAVKRREKAFDVMEMYGGGDGFDDFGNVDFR